MRTAVIVDDEELSVELLKYLIRRYEIPIEVVGEAYSGDEGLELINRLNPDVVFIDIRMPVMNGLEVIERVNAEHKGNVSFIIVTAYDHFEYAQTALRLGARDILLKPVEPELFLETAERILGYKRSNHDLFDRIIEYINLNYSEELELKDCAEKFHTSSSYIARMFKKYGGTSFSAYLNGLRIKNAAALLKETDLSIKEVCYKVGYNNLNYFYKVFKKCVGATPNVYKGRE
jgi:YesN/AraC family two-component response regulator